MTYLIFKALHLIGMVAWFAGLFYMFRLFVYHAENLDKPEAVALLKIMARKLYLYITVPAMVATFIFGSIMIAMNPAMFSFGWLHTKLTLVVLLAGYTGFIGKTRRRFEADDIFLTGKQCRMINEVPTLFLIAIVFLMVVLRHLN